MGFHLTYEKLLTLRCWHPDYLGSVAGQVPLPPAAPLTLTERGDYLAYDVRQLLDIRPTPPGSQFLERSGLSWRASTFGGWLLAKDTYVEADPAVRLQLGLYLRDPQFAAATNFGVPSVAGRLFHLSNANEAVSMTHSLTAGDLRAVHYVDSQGFQLRLPQLVPGTAADVQVRDPLITGNPVLRTLPGAAAAPDPDFYTLDLSGMPAGLYRFTGTNVANVNLLVGFTRDPGLLGVIDLRLADWAGAALDIHFQSSNP